MNYSRVKRLAGVYQTHIILIVLYVASSSPVDPRQQAKPPLYGGLHSPIAVESFPTCSRCDSIVSIAVAARAL